MQPILENLAEEFPGVEICAYIDDINLVSDDPQLLTKAFTRLQSLLQDCSLIVSTNKCMWFGGTGNIPMPQELSSAEVKKADCTIKVLGAFIGEESKVSEELVKSLQKHYEIFRRLKQMGINNTSAQLLSKCVNVRQNYQLRVHHPIVSENLAKLFDHEVEEVLNSWFGTLSQDQITQLRLPVKKGGLGLTACLPIRCAAFESSFFFF